MYFFIIELFYFFSDGIVIIGIKKGLGKGNVEFDDEIIVDLFELVVWFFFNYKGDSFEGSNVSIC